MRWLLHGILPLLGAGAYLLLEGYLKPYIWLLFFPAICASAWMDGIRGALVSGVVSGVLAFSLMEPRFSAAGHSAGQGLAFLIFFSSGLWSGWLKERLVKDQAAAKAREHEFRLMFETMSEGLALNEGVFNASGEMIDYRVLRVNSAFYQAADFRGGDPVGRLATELYGMDAESIRKFWLEHKDSRTNRRVEYLSPMRGRWFAVSTSPFAANHFVASFFDITALKETERALIQREAELARAQEIAKLGTYVWDIASGRLEWSEVNKAIWGFDHVPVFDEIVARLHPEDRDRILEAGLRTREEGIPFRMEYRIVLPDGAVRYLKDQAEIQRGSNGGPGVMIGTILDVTEIHTALESVRAMEAALEQSARIASLGVLARGIAHDFNNFLGAVFGHIELALAASREPRVTELLSRAAASIERARKLTGQLLTFAKGRRPELQTKYPGTLIEDAFHFALTGTGMRLHVEIAPDIWPVDIDGGQISQVLENLAINAAHACGGQGTITLRAFNAPQSGASVGLPAKDYVIVCVQDDGPGIPDDVLPHIFEPFYTTRSGGTGLGLTTSYSIMQRHNGTLVARNCSRGAEFCLYLPRSQNAVDTETQPLQPAAGSPPMRILVMDDQEDLRDVLTQGLAHLGHEALAVADGASAVAEFSAALAAGRPFGACIFDLTVPGGTGGLEAARQVRQLDPGALIVIASGYPGDLTDSEYVAAGVSAIVQKPFTLAQLRAILARQEE